MSTGNGEPSGAARIITSLVLLLIIAGLAYAVGWSHSARPRPSVEPVTPEKARELDEGSAPLGGGKHACAAPFAYRGPNGGRA